MHLFIKKLSIQAKEDVEKLIRKAYHTGYNSGYAKAKRRSYHPTRNVRKASVRPSKGEYEAV